MRKFSEYIDDQNQQIPTGNQPQVTPQMQQPQMQDQNGVEDLRKDIKKLVIKFQKLLDNKSITIDQTRDTLTELVNTIMSRTNISNAAAMQAFKAGMSGMRTNSEPMNSPPLQPMAQ